MALVDAKAAGDGGQAIETAAVVAAIKKDGRLDRAAARHGLSAIVVR